MPANINYSTLVALGLFLTDGDSINDAWQRDGEGTSDDDDGDTRAPAMTMTTMELAKTSPPEFAT